MTIELSAIEARVIGCLIEKAITTPDQYPLSLNALTNACNQKSNRDPVMDLDEQSVQQTLDGLVRKHLVMERSGFGSRVPKYQHTFCNTNFGSLQFNAIETAIICELLLRGPQTPGELRTHGARMAEIAEVGQVETALAHLESREDGPYVERLPREPNRREHRYRHLFSGNAEYAETVVMEAVSISRTASSSDRMEQLERQVAALRKELDELKQKLGD
ncbi:MAG TPA: DUF480 domain-containing protein [Steroidobacteraceae bacterium]|jgi:hypothetical protein|nr:DUF480 domain-containing protein [Steroidobacteraceae bacterium]